MLRHECIQDASPAPITEFRLVLPRSTGLSGFVHFRYGRSEKINRPLACLGRLATILQGGEMPPNAGTLNTALALEHEGINAYTLGAQSNLLQKPVLTLAVKFQDDHKAHRDRLIKVIRNPWGDGVIVTFALQATDEAPVRTFLANVL